jgi:TatD DNase family protein
MLIDTHSHIQFEDFDDIRADVLFRMSEMNVGTFVVGCDLLSSKSAVELARKETNIWAIVGLHPNTTNETFSVSDYETLLLEKKTVGVGECGMDFFRFDGDSSVETLRQEKEFRKQIECSQHYDKSLMLHVRPSKNSTDAHEYTVNILRQYPSAKGTSHFFTSTSEIARQYLDIGFMISFSGVITFARELEEVVRYVPLDMMLLETDAPYATPAPHRGKKNEPALVSFVAQKISEIKNIPVSEVISQTTKNACNLFSITL